jgi:Cobalamin-independent synthase, N-terminal domain
MPVLPRRAGTRSILSAYSSTSQRGSAATPLLLPPLARKLPVQGLHLDVINARNEIDAVIAQLPQDRVLSLGVINHAGKHVRAAPRFDPEPGGTSPNRCLPRRGTPHYPDECEGERISPCKPQ